MVAALCFALIMGSGLGAAWAGKEVRLLSWGGTIKQTFEVEGFAKKFEEKTGYKFVLVSKAKSSLIISTAIAQKNNPQVDVVMCDVGAWTRGMDQGIFEKLDANAIPNLNDVYSVARIKNVGVSPYGQIMCFLYNPEIFQGKGWAKPKAWKDIFRPEFSGMISIPPPDNTYGLVTLVMLARLGGGGESNIEAGLDAEKRLAPGVVTWETTYSRLGQLFQAREIAISIFSSGSAFDLKKKGFPVDYVIPENSTIVPVGVGMMKGAPNPEGAQALINFIISPEFLAFRAKRFNNVPLNRKTKLDAETSKRIVVNEEIFSRMKAVDWSITNQHRAGWVERWEKEVSTIKPK
jgi:putative spermidine/putrescine transport system substrate-binding protein